MCIQCWEDADRPKINNERVRAAVAATAVLYAYHGTGGYLHIVVDDWNLEDADLDFCAEEIEKNEDGWPEHEIQVHRDCLAALRVLTDDERISAMALHDGFWK